MDESTYGFSKNDAESIVKGLGAGDGDSETKGGSPRAQTPGAIFLTPGGGIDARVSDACGYAMCTQYYIGVDGDLAVQSAVTVKVYNIFSSAIAGDAYITAKRTIGGWVADAEDCG